jgi:hypothetical protein
MSQMPGSLGSNSPQANANTQEDFSAEGGASAHCSSRSQEGRQEKENLSAYSHTTAPRPDEAYHWCVVCEQPRASTFFKRDLRRVSGFQSVCKDCRGTRPAKSRSGANEYRVSAALSALHQLFRARPDILADVIRRYRPEFEVYWAVAKERADRREQRWRDGISLVHCIQCDRPFERETKRLEEAKKQGREGPFCSKHCALTHRHASRRTFAVPDQPVQADPELTEEQWETNGRAELSGVSS